MGKSWRDYVPTYLLTYYSSLNIYGGEPVHLLIVEGPDDEDFYFRLFAQLDFSLPSGEKIRFETPKKQIIANFSDNYESIFAKSNPYKFQKLKEEFKDADMSDYKGYEFVTTCIKYYEEHRNQFHKMDCYGIIDKDFGHENLTKELNNVTSSEMHDRETCLLRCYMSNLFDKLSGPNKKNALSIVKDVLDFTYKQGILEHASFKCKEDKGYLLRGQVLFTHGNFKNHASESDFRNFDFEAYFQNNIKFDNNYQDNSKFEKIIQTYLDDINKIYVYQSELIEILDRWLIRKRPTTEDNERINQVLTYSNGHILINQLILCCGTYFDFVDEHHFIDYFLEIIKKKQSKVFTMQPLLSYKKYRIDNGLYKKIE